MSRFVPRASDIILQELRISADRILLVPVREEFAEDIFKEFTASVTRYMFPVAPKSIEDTLAFIRESQKGMEELSDIAFGILLKDSMEFLGCCGLHSRESSRTPELGIWIKEFAHGSGYGREAVSALKTWSEENIEVDYFVYPVDRRNAASRKIAESLGGQIVSEKMVEKQNGDTLDEIVYHIPAKDQALRP